MSTLDDVLAHGVLDALRARELVAVPASAKVALCDELAAIIGPSLATLHHHLQAERRRKRPARHVLQGSLGHADAEEVVGDLVEQLTERLFETDHVDDIFAEDRVIRRSTHRAIRDILLGYIRGEVAVGRDTAGESFDVILSSLGYVVDMVVGRLDEARLREALERAAAQRDGRLVSLDYAARIGSFEVPGGARAARLGIEEAITAEVTRLVDEQVVELPCIEQVLELAEGTSSTPGWDAAIARAEAAAGAATGCDARCRLVDPQTVVVTLTPLSEDAAEQAEEHFACFLGLLEQELVALSPPASRIESKPSSAEAGAPASRTQPSQPPAPSATRQRRRRKSPRKRAK